MCFAIYLLFYYQVLANERRARLMTELEDFYLLIPTVFRLMTEFKDF